MKKIFLIFTTLFLIACFNNKTGSDEESKKNPDKQNLEKTENLKISSAEIDKVNNLIYFTFSKDVISSESKGSAIKEELLTFNPNTIKGSSYWADTNKLVFQIKDLEYGRNYQAEFLNESLSKLLGEDIENKDYSFKFKFETLKVENIKISYKNNSQKNTNLAGYIEFNKTFNMENILKDLSLKLDKKSLRAINTRADGNRLYFETEYIPLYDGEYNVTLNLATAHSDLTKEISHSEKILLTTNFVLTEAYAQEKNSKFKMFISLSRDIDETQDLKSFLYIDGISKYEIKTDRNTLIVLGDFTPGKIYDVKVFSGLKSTDGFSLRSDSELTITMPDLSPQMEFQNNGIYLAQAKQNTLRFKTLNVKSVYLNVKKVYEDNIQEFISRNSISSSKTNSNRIYGNQIVQFGSEIYGKKYTISSEKNNWIETDIDLSKILEEYDKSGMYIVEISYGVDDLLTKINDYPNMEYDKNNNANYYMIDYLYRSGFISKPLIISDISLLAKKTKDSIYVFTNSISKNSVLENVNIKLYDNKGKITSGTSDQSGVAKIEFRENLKYIEAEFNGEKSYIFPNRDLQDYTLMDNEGLVKPDGVDIFTYTERGVYRPGDKIYISAILREQGKKLPDNIPLNLKFYSPLNKLYTEKINLEGKNGLYSFTLETDANAPTGNWRAVFYLGKEKIRESFIKVETVVPPKIKAELQGKLEDNNYALTIKSDYLFGEPAADLISKTKFAITPSNFVFKKYKNYEFKDNLKTFTKIESAVFEKTLNKSGKAYIDYRLPEFDFAPYKLDITSSVDIFQKDGRKINKEILDTYDFYDQYVGLEKIDQDYVKIGTVLNLGTILISKDGENTIDEELTYKIYKNDYYWWWDYNTYDDYKEHFKKDQNTILLEEGKVNSGNKFNYKVDDYGNYYIEVNAKNGHSAGYFVNASYWGKSVDGKSASVIDLKSDKEEYQPGEKAEIIFDSPQSGYALVTLEKNNKILKSFRQKLDSSTTKVSIDITEEMIPNVYVNINMIQDINQIKNDRPIRLRALKSLNVMKKENKLEFDLKVNDELKSNEQFDVEIQTKDNKKTFFTIAVVDEGLLNLTNFKTPNPADYFYGKERNRIITYDLFDDILGINHQIANSILKPGGDFEAEMMMKSESVARFKDNQELGNTNVKRFKALSLYKGPLETDENGYAKVTLDMTDYVGAVRIMVVAVREEAYQAKEKTALVKTPIMIDAGMPRSLAPNDLFYSNLNIFFMEEVNGDAEVSLEIDGPAKVLGENKITLSDIKKGEQNFKFKIKVENKIGKLKAVYRVKTNDLDVEKVIDIAVNSSAPYVYISDDYTLNKSQIQNIAIDSEDVAGTSKAKITVAKVPRYNIDHRIKWLIRYPYGCVEQTVSSVFPQLYIDKVMKLNLKDWEETDKNINAAIERLQKFQLQNGALSYWQNESHVSEWGSIYALHFLSEAKQKGYYVPKDFFEQLQNYLYDSSSQNRQNDLTNFYRIYVLALSGKANISTMNYFKQSQLSSMDNTEKHLLAISYKLIDEDSTAEEILKTASTTVSDRDDWNSNFGSRLRDMALILETYSLFNKDEDSEKLFQEIIEALRSKKWYSTQTLSYALMSISKYADVKETQGSIKIRFKDSQTEEWTDISTDKAEAVIEVSDLLGKNIELENTSDQTLYLSYQWEGKRQNSSDTNSYNNEIKLFKYYYTTEGRPLRSIENLKRGDTFWIVYEIRKDYYGNYENMSLIQNLASGLEIENTRLNSRDYPEWMLNKYYGFNEARYVDIRDDKIMWFFDMYQYSDKQFFALKVNVVTEGVFYMPGAVTESMYYNYIGANSYGSQIVITE